MKKSIYLFTIIVLIISCNNSEIERLKDENNKLLAERNSKDSTINEFFVTLDHIEENLSLIKSKEGVISRGTSQNNEITEDTRQKIYGDIQFINELMEKNKREIASLKSKLKTSNLKIKKLEEMIVRYEQQLQNRDLEIEQLKQKLISLNFTVESLSASIDTLKQSNIAKDEQLAEKNQELNTAFYAIGTEKELKENKVISKTGGFIGIGKNQKIQQDFNTDYFKKIDITKTTSINIGAKNAKLLSTHPSESFKWEVNGKKTEKLIITNYKDFWRFSKYLVIVVD